MVRGIDVVMPAYNAGGSISAVLAQLERQRGVDCFRVIVVNDGSTDDTAERLAGVTRSWIHVIEQEHGGRAAARNVGLRAVQADVVAFLDADILVDSGWLHRHLSAQRAHPGVIHGPIAQTPPHAGGSAQDALDGLYELAAAFQRFSAGDDLAWVCVTAGSLSVPTRAVCEAGGFDPRFSGWGPEDVELGFRLHRSGLPIRALGGPPSIHLCPRRGTLLDRPRLFEQLTYFYRKHPHPEVRAYVRYVTGKLSCEELYAATTGRAAPGGRTYFRPCAYFSLESSQREELP
jgi:glycosyltransferase involved in cell wall biosynthesis